MGKAMLQIGAVFAEMERNLLRELTKAGLAAARARGRLGGRKPSMSSDGLDTARRLMADPMLTNERDRVLGWVSAAPPSTARSAVPGPCRPQQGPNRSHPPKQRAPGQKLSAEGRAAGKGRN